jgi:prepilin-type N-terminal cleavage/methylation domain-containing protein
MAKSFFSRLLKTFLKSRQRGHRRGHYHSQRHNPQGFTLVELLVVTAIAGIIVSGLTFIVIQMMTSDQREASRTETQREMQMALDYMASELREAVYVYPGTYLENSKSSLNTTSIPFANYLPASVTDGAVPVLAFWKQQPFPAAVKQQCAGTTAATNPAGIACLNGQSYALVVYSLAKRPAGSKTWKGNARITRYVLSQFDSKGSPNSGYVDPSVNNNLATWPWADLGQGARNLQGARPTGGAFTLVDYVSLDKNLSTEISQTGFCPAGGTTGKNTVGSYDISPSANTLTGDFAGIRSFYACVFSQTQTNTATGVVQSDPTQYRDVLLFLRGSAVGRPGVQGVVNNDQDVLPTVQTRVLNRSVLGRRPIAE